MGHVIWSGITWLRAGAGCLGEDIRGCWLPFLPFPFLTALFTLIAGIMVHPRPVLSQGGGVHVGGEGAKGKPAATERMKESASMDAGRARVDREGEDKPMSMERGERQAHDDGKGEGARVNGRRTSPRR